MPKFVSQPKSRVSRGEEFLRTAPEFFIFLACRRLVQDVRGLDRAFLVAEIEEAGLADRYSRLVTLLLRMAAATDRFGIVLPVANDGWLSPFFWAWFNWWDDYYRTLSREEITQVEALNRRGVLGLNDHRPPGDWLTYRQMPALDLCSYGRLGH